MKKITARDLRRLAQEMVRTKTMPTLETVLEAIAAVRAKYTKEFKTVTRTRRNLMFHKHRAA